MDKNIFGVYLAKEGVPNNEAYAKLDLPASPWALWDAMAARFIPWLGLSIPEVRLL